MITKFICGVHMTPAMNIWCAHYATGEYYKLINSKFVLSIIRKRELLEFVRWNDGYATAIDTVLRPFQDLCVKDSVKHLS